jgi:Raf kinase inhibitor-like YbhB/YbcL family protein
MVPPLYTCDGSHVSPPLSISGVPEGAKSLVLIVDDPDVPKAVLPAGVFDHWVLFNIPVTTTEIAQGGSAGTVGANSSGQNAYAGPCPPPQYDPPEHRYFFKLYALNAELPLKEGASKADVEKAMDGHVIAETRLMGRYERK